MPPYLLEPEDCAELLREGVQYYHRYVCFWHLGSYELCARDTERNLRLFAFVREHARHDRDKLRFDQWRPYVTMMHARAVATPLVELEQWDAAAGVLDAGIRGIERFLEEYNQVQRASEVGELTFLRSGRRKFGEDTGATRGETSEAPTRTLDPIRSIERPSFVLRSNRPSPKNATRKRRFSRRIEATKRRAERRELTHSPGRILPPNTSTATRVRPASVAHRLLGRYHS